MSSTTGLAPTGHPIARFPTGLHRALDSLDAVPAWSMTSPELQAVLVDLASAQARIEGLWLRVLAAADTANIAADSAATSTAAWVAHATRTTHPAAHAAVRLAHALDGDYPLLQTALAAGTVDGAQARVIARALSALPATVAKDQRDQAEQHLVQLAGEHDAAALKVLGRRVFEVIDPDAADLEEGRMLQAEEKAAARTTYLHVFDNGDGTHTGRFKIPDLHAAMLTKMLHALTSPARHATGLTPTDAPVADDSTPGHSPTHRKPSRPEALGQAFCELLERVPADRLPATGGTSATVVVLLDYDKLLSGLGAAHLDTGQPLSAAQARHLASSAGIIPAVYRRALDGSSVVLDMGRTTRLHTEHQRIALAIAHGGCTAENCDRPPAWTEAHHDVPWSAGGHTSLANGRLLCRYHHQRAHSPHYTSEQLPTGQLRFHRRE